MRIKADGKVYELKEDRSLFARMMLACKSRPEIDIKNAIGLHEFSVVPRSLFAADGTMFHCTNKSLLMSILEDLPSNQSVNITSIQGTSNDASGSQAAIRVRVDIVDGMAEVQSMKKTDDLKYCSDLADHFTARLFDKYSDCDELRLIFYRYDVPLSLKMATRARRQGQRPAIPCRITDSTNISKVTMKKLLAHVKTKMELTSYLARKTLEQGQRSGKGVTVAWSNQCQASDPDISHLPSDQEADTKLILHQ